MWLLYSLLGFKYTRMHVIDKQKKTSTEIISEFIINQEIHMIKNQKFINEFISKEMEVVN